MARVQQSMFLFIVGHVGEDDAGTDTMIASASDVAAALRSYNNSTRGVRAAKSAGNVAGAVCAAMYAPAARQIDTDELLKLWRTSRKLHCRVRAGVELAHELGLPCAVDRCVLASDAARKAMPQIAERVERDGDYGTAGSSSRRRRRRGRRGSKRDRTVAAHPRIVSMRAQDELAAVLSSLESLGNAVPAAAQWRTADELDELNSVSGKSGEQRCFTIGKTQPAVRARAPRVGLRQSSAAVRERAAALRDDVDGSDESSPPVRATPPLTDTALDALELDMYAANAARAARASASLAARDVCGETRVSAADTARVVCTTAQNELDNAALVARADDCYADANEFVYERPLARVKLHRARSDERRCVCGARLRRSEQHYVCADRCGRTSQHTLLYRTDVAALKHAAKDGGALQATRRERRALRSSVRRAELRRPIDEYGAGVVSDARRTLGLDRRMSPHKRARKEAPLEASVIAAAFANTLSN